MWSTTKTTDQQAVQAIAIRHHRGRSCDLKDPKFRLGYARILVFEAGGVCIPRSFTHLACTTEVAVSCCA